ncbi:MAG: TerB family tellurite resistance protein [Deltaproteobacteria bacterium]|nr:TerB family tellurite resistance protein [Deltaproteobacteria bacterium]
MVFLIIFGTRGVTTTVASGTFFCPGCMAKRSYEHQRVRRFFTLYFIPIIPLDTIGEYVECLHCKDTYKTGVLDFDPDELAAAKEKVIEAEFHAAVKRVMVLMMLADGKIEEAEMETIQLIYGKLAKSELSRDALEKEIAAARSDGRGLRAYLSSLVGSLNDSGKETVVKAAYFVASADGHVSTEETNLLGELASALEMSPAQFKAIVDKLAA